MKNLKVKHVKKKHLFQGVHQINEGRCFLTIWVGCQGEKIRLAAVDEQIYIVFLSDASVLADFLCFVQTLNSDG